MHDNRTYTEAEKRDAAEGAEMCLRMFIAGPTGATPREAAHTLYNLAHVAYHITTELKDGVDRSYWCGRTADDLLHHAENLFLQHYPLYADARRVRLGFAALRALVVDGAKGKGRRDALVRATWLRNLWHNSYLETACMAQIEAREREGDPLPPGVR